MAHEETHRIIEKFQHRFVEVFENQIHQVIQESRQEAFSQAKEILKDRTLQEVLDNDTGNDANAPELDVKELSKVLEDSTVVLKQVCSKEERLSPHISDQPGDVEDPLLREIEAIREQIIRNEQLLNQIKPFIEALGVSENE